MNQDTSQSPGKAFGPYRILVVEDNTADAKLIRWAIQGCNAPVTVDVQTNGMDALEYLRCGEGATDGLRPNAMLVDLNLPKIDGCEFLRELKQDPQLSDIPVIVFSTSHRSDDRERCLQNKAVGFFTKPSDLDEFELLVKHLVEHEFPRALTQLT